MADIRGGGCVKNYLKTKFKNHAIKAAPRAIVKIPANKIAMKQSAHDFVCCRGGTGYSLFFITEFFRKEDQFWCTITSLSALACLILPDESHRCVPGCSV
jgi:hypothetical protein